MPQHPHGEQDLPPFGKLVRRLLRQRGWTQKRLAHAIGMHPSGMTRLLRGHRRAPRAALAAIERALDLSAAEAREVHRLAYFDDPPVEPPTAEEARQIIDRLRARWLGARRPAAVLVDVFWTIWAANETFLRVFTGGGVTLGRSNLTDLLLDPALGMRDALSPIARDEQIDAFVRAMLSGVVGPHSDTGYEQWYLEILDQLRARPLVRDYLDAHRPHTWARSDEVKLVRHLHLTDGGHLTVHIHALRRDRRFALILLPPADLAAALAIERRAAAP